MLETLSARLTAALAGRGQHGRVEVDTGDPDGQTLLVVYPVVTAQTGDYIRPVVRIESGAKSALDPNKEEMITPYVAPEVSHLDLQVPRVVTVDPRRTFWDKVVIVHGLRRWHENKGELRNEGNRVTRHYYDLHCMLLTDVGKAAVADAVLAADCVQHARLFFDRPANDLASAVPGTYAVYPNPEMIAGLREDYARMSGMIFGEVPDFDAILTSIGELDKLVNSR